MHRLFLVIFALSLWPAVVFGQIVPENRQQISLSFSPVVKKVSPAVVNIYTQRIVKQQVSPFLNDPFFREFFGQGISPGLTRERVEKSLGSGVIVSPDGLIVTNAHVIKDAQEITVDLADRREFPAEVVSNDTQTDLAVLRILPGKSSPLPYLTFQDSDSLEVGDMVLAVGNPFGVGQTVTSGIVSALARTEVGVNDLNFFIQTDAAINPGNSGGALVSMSGSLVGINSAIYSRTGGSLGIGFAIPSNMVRTVVDAAKDGNKKIVRPWMGVEGQPITADIASSLGLSRPVGVLVNGFHPQSPALKSGLQIGDVITAVNNQPVDDIGSLRFRIATLPLGGKAVLHVTRKGIQKDISIDLKGPPEIPARDERILQGKNPLAGLTVVNISPAVLEELRLNGEKEGVVISAVNPRSPAAQFGFSKGDILAEINGQKVDTTAHLEKIMTSSQGRWAIRIQRGEQSINVVITG